LSLNNLKKERTNMVQFFNLGCFTMSKHKNGKKKLLHRADNARKDAPALR